ncbi:hypothetical protein P4C99_15365 [Pontiellaceae bacterium B1224]|nr:hypothetical protein [Pontiellaceae bacterium B1224]
MTDKLTEQINLLGIFHYVVGGIMALLSCMPFIHVFMGLMIVNGGFAESGTSQSTPPDAWFGWIFVIMGSIAILLGWLSSIAILIAGNKLRKKKNRMYCLVIAGIECMFMPLGTVLGVFTLIALTKEESKTLFA